MSPKVYHISIELILCLPSFPGYESYQEEWLSYPVRIHWRKLFLCHQKTNADVFLFVDGTVSTFHFQWQHPHWTWTCICILVCIAAISFSSCVHQFPCFLGIFYYICPYVSFCLQFWLVMSPLKLEGRFSWSFLIGTEYYETSHSLYIAVRLRFRYISH